MCRTVTDLEMENNLMGMLVAALSVVSSGMQQIFCRSMQQKHGLSSHELLANTAPAQVALRLLRNHHRHWHRRVLRNLTSHTQIHEWQTDCFFLSCASYGSMHSALTSSMIPALPTLLVHLCADMCLCTGMSASKKECSSTPDSTSHGSGWT